MIKVNHVIKSYGKTKALNDVDLSLSPGRVIALLGPNGSGKTTLIKSILGLVQPEGGSIIIDGNDIRLSPAYRSRIGYMPQIGKYPDNMTIAQVIRMLKEIRKDCTEYDDELIKNFGLDKIESKTMKSLSGGTRQKVSACLAFLFKPGILILDEPTAGLDPLSNEILKEKIISEKAKGKLILITSHVLSDLEDITSHIIYLYEGKLVFYDTIEELENLTGHQKLNSMIASIMKKKDHQ